jgi:prophage antirepressor-like protein
MSNLSFFEFESKHVRTATCSGEIAFCLVDVLLAMNSTTTVTAVKAAVSEGLGDEYVINILILDSLGREQDTAFILEAGLTFLLARSRTEIGKQLNRLIHTEILPSLRKTGRYSVNPTSTAPQQTQVLPKTTAEMLLVYAQQLVEQEQRMTDAEQRISAIEQRSIDAAEELNQLPPSKEPAPPLTERASLRQLVNKWCDATNVDRHIAWRKLYIELYYRDGFNVNTRMKKGEYKTKLDLIASYGKIGVLYGIACDIFGNGNSQGGSHA